MITTPAFKKCFRVEVVPSEGVFILSEGGRFVLSGAPVFEAVAALIDGSRSADDIARALSDRIRAEDVYYALMMMEQQSLIDEATEDDNDPRLLVWHHLGVNLKRAKDGLRNVSVSVVATPELDAEPFVEALEAYGLTIAEGGEFTVVFTSDYLTPSLAELNRSALASGHPWMLAKPVGAVALIGPLFQPGATACWQCLATRLRQRRALEVYFDSHDRGSSPARNGMSPNLTESGMKYIAAFQAAKWVALGTNPQINGKIVSFDLSTMVTTTHVIIKRPQCPDCGAAVHYGRPPSPPLLDNRIKAFSVDTGHRSLSPEETFAQYQHHVSPISGIVGEITPVQGQRDDLVKLWIADHNFSFGDSSLSSIKESIRTKSCGKGITDAQARTSALIEALERYCGVYQGDEPRIKSSYQVLKDKAIHPNACMLYSERQYKERDDWRKLGSTFTLVPDPFNEAAEMEWTPVWSFEARAFRYLPTSYLYYGHPNDGASIYCWADSNGNAAGNSLEEAMLHGFLELVERDAVAIWWYNRLSLPGVDIHSFGDPYFERFIDYYNRMNREIWAVDITSDFGIPTFAAVSRRIDQPAEEIILGFGAHLDARVALMRALTEINQFLPAVNGPVGPNGSRQYAYSDPLGIRWWQTAKVAMHPYLLPNLGLKLRQANQYAASASNDQLVDIMVCVSRAQVLGMDTLLLDQTRPDVGIRVAKVIVPGIRHFWARLAPGRLYDVPVKMNWLPRRLREEELNPVPMFL